MISNSAVITLLACLFLCLFPAQLKLIYMLPASIALFLLTTGMAAKQHRREYLGLFFTQLFLFVAALFFSSYWFLSGGEFTPPDYWIWTILQRGSLAAIETSAGILGIGNFLFVWIYSERDKLTLGRSQSDLIERQLGRYTYTLSVTVHFISTVLCVLLTKTRVREGAFLAFLTLISGCVLQAMVCFQIALNRRSREKLAIKAWKEEPLGGCYLETPVITKMSEFLGDPAVYANQEYRKVLFLKIGEWLGQFPGANENRSAAGEALGTPTVQTGDLSRDIKTVSSRLRAILEKAPVFEASRFSEQLVDAICRNWDTSLDADQGKKEFCFAQAELLACGYLHYLYSIGDNSRTGSAIERKIDFISTRISALTYFSSSHGQTFSHINLFLRKLLEGLEWYLFLTQRTMLPRYTSHRSGKVCGDDAGMFTALIQSIFDKEDPAELRRLTTIAWTQV